MPGTHIQNTMQLNENSLRTSKEADESYIFQSKIDRVRRGNLSQKKNNTAVS